MDPASVATSRSRVRKATPLSDSASSFGINSDDANPAMNVISSPTIISYSENDVNPNDFISLQRCLESKELESSPIDFDPKNLSPKDGLEKSLVKEFISIDILNEDNQFYCDNCRKTTPGEIFALLLCQLCNSSFYIMIS